MNDKPAPTIPTVLERCLVDESSESFSEFLLSDGTTIRAKISFTYAFRTDQHDDMGFPFYQIMGVQTTFLVANCNEELKASKQ